MTSRGSLAYYLAAWVCGCSFMALAFWIELQFSRGASLRGTFQGVSFLGFCFFGLFFGAVPALLFAWILRRLLKSFQSARLWLWIVMGAGIAFLLVWCLVALGQVLRDPRALPYSALPFWPFMVVGPLALSEGRLWITLPVGAATAAILFAVNRTFAQKAES
jgi:hypothetical protein